MIINSRYRKLFSYVVSRGYEKCLGRKAWEVTANWSRQPLSPCHHIVLSVNSEVA